MDGRYELLKYKFCQNGRPDIRTHLCNFPGPENWRFFFEQASWHFRKHSFLQAVPIPANQFRRPVPDCHTVRHILAPWVGRWKLLERLTNLSLEGGPGIEPGTLDSAVRDATVRLSQIFWAETGWEEEMRSIKRLRAWLNPWGSYEFLSNFFFFQYSGIVCEMYCITIMPEGGPSPILTRLCRIPRVEKIIKEQQPWGSSQVVLSWAFSSLLCNS